MSPIIAIIATSDLTIIAIIATQRKMLFKLNATFLIALYVICKIEGDR